MTKILVAYHTSEGQTARIAERVAEVLGEDGDTAEVVDLAVAPSPAGYDGVVVGDSIHATHHSPPMTKYLKRYSQELNATPSALFQVCLASANPDDEHTTAAQGLVHELLEHTGFDPDMVGLFAGALVYTRYGWFTRRIMRAIVKHEGGDTDTSHDYEYTDWEAVEQFAHDVHALVTSSARPLRGSD
jgi:menaquinone-dependent protoporphyrinogen oxidase